MTTPTAWERRVLPAGGFVYLRRELKDVPVRDTINQLARDLGAHASRTIFNLPANMARAEYVSEAIRGVVRDAAEILKQGRTIPEKGTGIISYEHGTSLELNPDTVPVLRGSNVAPDSLVGYIHLMGEYRRNPKVQVGCLDITNRLHYRYDVQELV